MTYRQYGTLRYILGHEINAEYVRRFNLTTFGSLLQRGWIKRTGDEIILTEKGLQAFDQYNRALPSYRKYEGELSDRVALMLNLKHQGIVKKGAA